MPQKFSLKDKSVTVGSARMEERGKFVKFYINNGKIYMVTIALLEELLKGKKRFVEILG